MAKSRSTCNFPKELCKMRRKWPAIFKTEASTCRPSASEWSSLISIDSIDSRHKRPAIYSLWLLTVSKIIFRNVYIYIYNTYMFDWLGCWFWVARLPAATPGPRNLEKVHQQPGITRPCCDFWRILRLKTHTHIYYIYKERYIWLFFLIFLLARPWQWDDDPTCLTCLALVETSIVGLS